MNIENLRRLQGYLLDNRSRFDISYGIGWGIRCGTVFCIAGAAAMMANPDIISPPSFVSAHFGPDDSARNAIEKEIPWLQVRDTALRWLGLQSDPNNSWYGHNLFRGPYEMARVTVEEAVEAIENVINGEEPWQ